MAVGKESGTRPANEVYHSDRGRQYTARKIKELAEKSGFRKSMSRPGILRGNQPIEGVRRVIVKYFEFY